MRQDEKLARCQSHEQLYFIPNQERERLTAHASKTYEVCVQNAADYNFKNNINAEIFERGLHIS